MLKHIKLVGVGPAPEMDMEFGRRLNLITGDNGLGKSFILEAAWWSLTRTWAGHFARPRPSGKAEISFQFDGAGKENTYTSTFDRQYQAWTNRAGRPANPGLVIYARVDGGFAVWDPARNYWRKDAEGNTIDRPPAYIFQPHEVWDGMTVGGKTICNGLIRDWVSWQFGDQERFSLLQKALDSLSPGGDETMKPGKPAKIDIDDARLVPTLRMPYGEDVPVTLVSAGMRRAIALAYLLVWSWREHIEASRLMNTRAAKQVIFLVDEIEAHLHPKWQRVILTSLLSVVDDMAAGRHAVVQLIAATHSPLVLMSMEPIFNAPTDAWFDLDLERVRNQGRVVLRRRVFQKRGDVSAWLTSEAFDLETSRTKEAESALRKAKSLMRPGNRPGKSELHQVESDLSRALPETDPFWVRWTFLKEGKSIK